MFTVSDLIAAVAETGSDASKLELLLAMTCRRQYIDAADDAAIPWEIRYADLIGGTDTGEMAAVFSAGVAIQPGTAPPLLFDGQQADLTDFNAPKPRIISCGDFSMPYPTNRQAIDAMTRDPSMGVLFTYHLMRSASGADDAEILALPQQVFAQIEEGCGFLYRDFVMRITGLFA